MTSREKEMAEAIQQIELDDANEPADAVYVRPKAPRSPAQVYSVRIPVDRIEELRVVAERQGKLPTALIREWVIERLDSGDSATASVLEFPLASGPASRGTTSIIRQIRRRFEVA